MMFLLLAVLLVPSLAWGAIAEVGSGSQRSVSTTDCANVDSCTEAFPGSVTSGNLLLVVGVNWQNTAGGAASISVTSTCSSALTVNRGATFDGTNNNYNAFIAYGFATSSGACTVTVDPSGTGNYLTYTIDELSGVHATPLDVDGGQSTGSSTSPADGITTSNANSLIVGVIGQATAGNITLTPPGGTCTQIGEYETQTTVLAHNAVICTTTTAGANTLTWTMGSSGSWAAKTLSLREATGAAPDVVPFYKRRIQ